MGGLRKLGMVKLINKMKVSVENVVSPHSHFQCNAKALDFGYERVLYKGGWFFFPLDPRFSLSCVDCGLVPREKIYYPEDEVLVLSHYERVGVDENSMFISHYEESYQVECEYANKDMVITHLSVPSGKIIVNDDLREFFGEPEEKSRASYNTTKGVVDMIKGMEQRNVAYGAIGNSCPTLYRTGDNEYAIIPCPQDELEEEGYDSSGEWEELTVIVTDLWAYSFADYDDYLAHGGEEIYSNEHRGQTPYVFDVDPGEYVFEYYGLEDEFELMNKGIGFAKFYKKD